MLNKLLKIMGKSSSPKGGKRGCLGKDGKYAIENCTGELANQGIGSTVQQGGATVTVVDGVKTIVRSNG
jgi:hypothetical protein